MILLPVFIAVGLLIAMVSIGKLQPFLAFIIAAIIAAIMLGMPIETIPKTIEHGIGDMLGSLAVTICVGAMFGKIIAETGVAEKIASSLIGSFGIPLIAFSMALTGLIIGIPLYYNVGFVIMVPLIFGVAQRTNLPVVYVGIPLLAGLSTAHGFLPPHPSPQALVVQFNADMGLTLIYGLIVSIPTIIIAGPIFVSTLKKIEAKPSKLFTLSKIENENLPSNFLSFFIALFPVLLIAITTALKYFNENLSKNPLIEFIGNPMIVLIFSLLLAVLLLGFGKVKNHKGLLESLGSAIADIAPILMIIGGAGALKQVLVDSGISKDIAAMLQHVPLNLIILSWLIALILRVLLGSATVAGLTTAGLLAPIVSTSGANPNLVVLAVGAGSLMFSHVNDSGFWMFKEYFNLSLKDTFKSWTVMETLVGSFGLIFILILSNFV